MSEWNQESVEQQAAELEKTQQQPEKPEPEPQEQPEAKEKVTEQVEKVVPLPALQEERKRRQRLEAEKTQLASQLAELQRQQQEVMARLTQQQQPQAPDPSVDPAGAILHTQRQTQEQLAALHREQQQARALQAQQLQWNQFVASVQAEEAEFAKTQPDVGEAINFLKAGRAKQYEAMGWDAAQVAEQIKRDELHFIIEAKKRGENPAEVGYRMAQAAGYVAPAKKLEMQKEGQGASGAGTQGGGGKGGGMPSYEALLKMSPEEFSKATSGSNWAKLMNR